MNAPNTQACANLHSQLLAAANYIDALGGDSKSYRAALASQPAQAETVVLEGWTPLTPRMYGELDGTYWLADDAGNVLEGEYEWRQGWGPNGFNTEAGRIKAECITHVMTQCKPTHPSATPPRAQPAPVQQAVFDVVDAAQVARAQEKFGNEPAPVAVDEREAFKALLNGIDDARQRDWPNSAIGIIESLAVDASAALQSARSGQASDSVVHVCPEKDSICGDRPSNWCATCPKRVRNGQDAKPFPAPGAWFPTDVLGSPMREFQPGKYETAQWPSERSGQDGGDAGGEAIHIEAVAEMGRIDFDDGSDEPRLDWLIEGGEHAVPYGTVLLMAHKPVTDDNGKGTVYIIPQPAAAPAEGVIAGALFDFLGFLTTSDRRWTFSACDDASPAVEALEQWAAKRGLSLADANVKGWRAAAPAATVQGAGQAATVEPDPLQGATNWLREAIHECDAADIAGRLSIGHNRAKRLLDAANKGQSHG